MNYISKVSQLKTMILFYDLDVDLYFKFSASLNSDHFSLSDIFGTNNVYVLLDIV